MKTSDAVYDPRYLVFFDCFNRADYYEAHEELEALWHTVRPDGDYAEFYKGLIMLAGAFTHLKLHALNDRHPVHARRLRPAGKLLRLSLARLERYPPMTQGVEVKVVSALCLRMLLLLESYAYTRNPWRANDLPLLEKPS